MSEVLMQVKGVNGQIELLADRVRIKRKGVLAFMTQGLKGDKEIRLSQITAIQFKQAGMVTNGYVQFSLPGGVESTSGVFDATKDENTVMFNRKQRKSFEELRQAIDQRIAAFGTGGQVTSAADELEKFARLRDQGIITEEEFEAKKKQILGL